jgi:hypothetical protein
MVWRLCCQSGSVRNGYALGSTRLNIDRSSPTVVHAGQAPSLALFETCQFHQTVDEKFRCTSVGSVGTPLSPTVSCKLRTALRRSVRG